MRPLSEFDPAWPHGHVQKCGRPARILAQLNNTLHPLAVAYINENGDEMSSGYASNGQYLACGAPDHRDLVNAPAPKKRVQGWLNVYRSADGQGYGGAIHLTQEGAKANCRQYIGDHIACIYIDAEEGEGLS